MGCIVRLVALAAGLRTKESQEETRAMSGASFASLGPTLLARKGGAKPAMRPQIAPLPGVVPPKAEQLEDLGWNDMGQDYADKMMQGLLMGA